MTKEVKAVEEVVEAEFTEVEAAPVEEQGKPIACGFSVIMTEDGDISFHPHGANPSLVTMDGLLKYAERYLEREWAPRLAPAQAAE